MFVRNRTVNLTLLTALLVFYGVAVLNLRLG